MDEERDRRIRLAAFERLRQLTELYGDALPRAELVEGIIVGDERVSLMGQQGIGVRKGLLGPISITTSPSNPYGDEVGDDGFLRYRYQGEDPERYDNVALRRAQELGLPLAYFHGLSPGWYQAHWPVFVHADDRAGLTFTIAFDDPQLLRPDLTVEAVDEARQAYVTQLVLRRLHQAKFRVRVLAAYDTRCAICRLRHAELLDAAHIRPDRPGGESPPIVPNGLALCKIHHAAFDTNILGIRPDHVIEVRTDVLREVDGPMLEHGLQGHHGGVLLLPKRVPDRPRTDFLEERYDTFRAAS